MTLPSPLPCGGDFLSERKVPFLLFETIEDLKNTLLLKNGVGQIMSRPN